VGDEGGGRGESKEEDSLSSNFSIEDESQAERCLETFKVPHVLDEKREWRA